MKKISYLKIEFKNYLELKDNNIFNLNKYTYEKALKTLSIYYFPFKENKEKRRKYFQSILKCNIA